MTPDITTQCHRAGELGILTHQKTNTARDTRDTVTPDLTPGSPADCPVLRWTSEHIIPARRSLPLLIATFLRFILNQML